MRKILILTLALLMLWGCAAETPDPTTAPVTEPTEAPTEEIVISHDALEMLEFDYEDIYTAAPMGDDLLLFSGMDNTTLIKVSGRNHRELASISTGVPITPGSSTLQISESGVCYATEEEYIFLDENLEEVERITLPDAWGHGAVTADQQTIYYSTGSELRAYSRQTGLDRLLRNTMHAGLALESLEVNDSVLMCTLLDQSAVSPTLFYSTATGELLATFDSSITLSSAGDLWMAKSSDGQRNQIVLGGSGKPQVLTAWESSTDVTLVGGGVLIRTRTEDAAAIRFLNLTDGTAAAIPLEEQVFVTNAWLDDGILWIALDDGTLCRWELDASEMQAAASCLSPYYSRENPDTEGLAALEPVILNMEETHGVKIHIFEDAVAAQPADMILLSEYDTARLGAGLETLDTALRSLTPEFLASLGKASDDGKVHICLVRSVSGEGCIQFWDENGIARIAVAADDDLQQHLFHGLGHIIDARVLTKTGAFDTWKNLNPQGFSYSYDRTAPGDSSAFPGAFADALAMVSPVEDRACTFTRAIMPGSDEIFADETMQKKLSTLCTGIRKAFGLKDSEEVFPWEQYLAE